MPLPSLPFIVRSLALWLGRYNTARLWLAIWERRRSWRYWRWHEYRHNTTESARDMSADRRRELREKWWPLYEEADEKVAEWTVKRDEAHRNMTTRKRQRDAHGGERPRIVSGRALHVRGRQGPIGAVKRIAGHYTAGPVDQNLEHAQVLFTQYAVMHNQMWGDGVAYHVGFARDGTVILLRPFRLRGIGVGGHNTGTIHVVFHGSTGDRPSAEQQASYRWFCEHGHTSAMPSSHRLPRSADHLSALGHNDFSGPGGQTACPGLFRTMIRAKGRTR